MWKFINITALMLIYIVMSAPSARSCVDARIICYDKDLIKGSYWAGAKWHKGRCCAIWSQTQLCNSKVIKCYGKCNGYEAYPYACVVK